MKPTKSSILAWCAVLSFFGAAFVLQHMTFAQKSVDDSNLKDRIAIQEQLLYAYAYAYDSKDCVAWANLFTPDASLDVVAKRNGKDAILQACITWQKTVVGDIKTRHYMTNIVFDELTPSRARTRTYCVVTWQKPGDPTPSTHGAVVYRDVIVKQSDGRWLFKERVATDPQGSPAREQ
jgi:ketosteroid isomerase-like protein